MISHHPEIGTNIYLVKYCKWGLNKGLETSVDTNRLFAVGADERGGRFKVMRSLNQLTVVGLFTFVPTKINIV